MLDTRRTFNVVKVPFNQETHEQDMARMIAQEVADGWQLVSAYAQTVSEQVEGFSIPTSATYIIFGK